MSNIQDCAAMIAADMRNLADDIAAGRATVGQSVWRSYADRVEALGTGNVAKMREAASEQKLDPKIKYSVTNFKLMADFGAASTHGGRSCIDCKNCQGYSECNHPCLQKPFKLGTHADRMGCRNGWEAAK